MAPGSKTELERYEQVAGAVLDAVREGTPFSLVRFGDGEGLFMGCGESEPPHRAMMAGKFFGDPNLAARDGDRITRAAADAFLRADFCGVPPPAITLPSHAYAVRSARHHGLFARGGGLMRANFHWVAHQRGLLRRIAARRDVVGLVTGRDVAARVKQDLKVGAVRQFLVPPQASDAFCKGFMRHYPDRFEELARLIEVPYRGALFFVGAGLLGKVYCQMIKDRGGIALDIGSVFDIWYGLKTRAYMDEPEPVGIERYLSDHALMLSRLHQLGPPRTYLKLAGSLEEDFFPSLATMVLFAGCCLYPAHPGLRCRLGEILAEQNLTEAALAEGRAALALSPTMPRARSLVARMRAAQDRAAAPARAQPPWLERMKTLWAGMRR